MLRPHLLQCMATCGHYGGKKRFFCEEDKRILCDSCLLAPEHKDHQVLPLKAAANKCKDKLQDTLIALQKKEKELKMELYKVEREESFYKEYGYTFKQSIISEYRKLHEFLRDEENKNFQRLDQESRDNMVKLEENEAKLSRQIQKLQCVLVEIEENLDKVPLEMLRDMKDTVERNKQLLLEEPELVSFQLTTCPITGLREILMRFQRDITLDPESANAHLIVSEDLRRVQYVSVPQDLPDNQERFDYVLAVLGAQTFTSGKHYWEVEIGDKTEWELGVCKDSVSRKRRLPSSAEDVRTLKGCISGKHFFLLNSHRGFQLIQPIHKVGIFLYYEMGHIAFYDVVDRSLIHSTSYPAFGEPLRPYFSFGMPKKGTTPASLVICPINNQ